MRGCEFACAHACQVLSVKRRVVNFNELGVDSGAERRSALALPSLLLLEGLADTGHVLHSFITV